MILTYIFIAYIIIAIGLTILFAFINYIEDKRLLVPGTLKTRRGYAYKYSFKTRLKGYIFIGPLWIIGIPFAILY